MTHYTDLGLAKLRWQAETEHHVVRCPRDGAVMRVLRAVAEPRDADGEARRFAARLPDRRRWRVRELDLECPACQRRAEGIQLRCNGPITAGQT